MQLIINCLLLRIGRALMWFFGLPGGKLTNLKLHLTLGRKFITMLRIHIDPKTSTDILFKIILGLLTS
jgi:hypothetical protein